MYILFGFYTTVGGHLVENAKLQQPVDVGRSCGPEKIFGRLYRSTGRQLTRFNSIYLIKFLNLPVDVFYFAKIYTAFDLVSGVYRRSAAMAE